MTEIKAVAFYVQDKKKRKLDVNLKFEETLDKFQILQEIYNVLAERGVADSDYQVTIQKRNEENFSPWFSFAFEQETGNFEID